jgi:hypothetical protein
MPLIDVTPPLIDVTPPLIDVTPPLIGVTPPLIGVRWGWGRVAWVVVSEVTRQCGGWR